MKIHSGVRLTVPGADRFYDNIRAGNAFSIYAAQLPVVGEFSHIQLFNPAASGVNTIVKSIAVSTGIASSFLLSTYNTALTTLAGTGVNLLSGNPLANCVVRRQTNPANLGTLFEEWFTVNSASVRITDEWHIEIGPGEGVVVINETANDALRAIFRWIELAI